MAIRQANNKVEIGNSETPFGGDVVDLSYSVNFSSSPSSMSVKIANESGEYENPDLNSENPLLIKFGNLSMNMLPVAYKKTGGASGKTMTIEFDDMGLKYLDKTFVLLDGKQLSYPFKRIIKIGDVYVQDKNSNSGGLKLFYGGYRPDATVKYTMSQLADGIKSAGIPISNNFYNYLDSFEGFKREDSGTLRDVLSGLAAELGFIFFWNSLKKGEPEGCLDFIKLEKDIDIEEVRKSIEKYTKECNILDETEEVSIRGSSLKGAIGSCELTPNFKRGKSEPFARFKFYDVITSAYTGNKIDLVKSSKRLRFDLELLMKASLVSQEFYRKYVMLKLIRAGFHNNSEDFDVVDQTLAQRNQKMDGNTEEPQDEGKIIGRWFKQTAEAKYPLNIQRNSAVELLYDLGICPAIRSADRFVKQAVNPDRIDEDLGIAEDNSTFGKEVQRYIHSQESFILGLNDEQPRWVGAVIDKGPKIDAFLKNDGQDPVYAQVNFLAKNFSRYYFSVSQSGRADRPSLIIERNFKDRTYGGGSPSFIFSDLAAIESPLRDVYSFVMFGLGEEIKYTQANYTINKGGQSQPKTVVLPRRVRSPKKRTFTVDGYSDLISTYGFLKYRSNSPRRAVTSGSSNDDIERTPTSSYLKKGKYLGFHFETLGITTSEDVPLSAELNNVVVRGTSFTSKAGSLSQESYSEIQERRTSGKREAYIYPTDLDYGILLYDSYSDSAASNTPQLDFKMQFAMMNDNLPSEIDANFKRVEKSLFVTELPTTRPKKENSIKDLWGATLELDEMDQQLLNTQLPFTLAKTVEKLRFAYSYSIDDALIGVRSSYIPVDNIEKVTKIEVEDVSLDISELQPDSSIETEYPPDGDLGNPDVSLLTENLKDILKLYVDENISPSISKDFTLAGFGFGDEELIPSISEGLESINVSLNQSGVSTTIKIGSKRRNRESIQLRRNLLLGNLAGSRYKKVIGNPVNTTFSNKLLSKY